MHGRHVIYGTGFAIMTVSFVLCGFAPSAFWLIVFRLIQGLGAAMIASATRVLAMEAQETVLKLLELGKLPAAKTAEPEAQPEAPVLPPGAALSHDGKNYWIGAECYTLDGKFLFALESA